MLEVLRGAAAGTLPQTFPAMLNMFSSLLTPLLTLHAAFKHVAPVVALLLKLADDIVENLEVYIESVQQREQLLNWTLQLLMQYRDSNLWQVGGNGLDVISYYCRCPLLLVHIKSTCLPSVHYLIKNNSLFPMHKYLHFAFPVSLLKAPSSAHTRLRRLAILITGVLANCQVPEGRPCSRAVS